MTVTEFLESRISEDEREASKCLANRANSKRRWHRVLAECAAKRAIVSLAREASEFEKDYDDYEWQGTVKSAKPLTGDATLYALAAVYKDHPDYQQEWAPDAV